MYMYLQCILKGRGVSRLNRTPTYVLIYMSCVDNMELTDLKDFCSKY